MFSRRQDYKTNHCNKVNDLSESIVGLGWYRCVYAYNRRLKCQQDQIESLAIDE
jgi:hypothetical protein